MQSTKNTSIFNVTTYYVAVVLSIACLLTTGCADMVARQQAERQKQGMAALNKALQQQHAKAQAEHMANRAALAKYCKCDPDKDQGEGLAKWLLLGGAAVILSNGTTRSGAGPEPFTPEERWWVPSQSRDMTRQEKDQLPVELQEGSWKR